MDSDCVDDILIEVVNEDDRESLEELSFINSFAAPKDFGGEDDLELAFEDFLDEAVEVFETLRTDVVELFLVEDVDPSLIIPKLIASSSAISLLVSGSVNIPLFSSMRPLRSASWKVIAPSSASPVLEETLMVLLTV